MTKKNILSKETLYKERRPPKFLKSGILLIILCVIICSVLQSLLLYRCREKFDDLYMNRIVFSEKLQNTKCVSLSPNMQYYGNSFHRDEFYTYDFIELYKEHESTDKVYGFDICGGVYNDSAVNINIGYSETYDLIDTELQSGTWFSRANDRDKYPAAVVSGVLFKNVNIGDVIKIQKPYKPPEDEDPDSDTAKSGSFEVKVVGKVGFPYNNPDFSMRFENDDPIMLINNLPAVYLLHDKKSVKAMTDAGYTLMPDNTFIYVTYKDDHDGTKYDFQRYVKYFEDYGQERPDFKTIEDTDKFLDIKNAVGSSLFNYEIFDNMVLSFTFFCWTLITFTVFGIISRNLRKKSGEYRIKASVLSSIKYVLIMTTIPLVISFSLFLNSLCTRYGIEFSEIISSGMLGSELVTKSLLTALTVWLFLSITCLIIPMMRFRSLKKSIELSAQSYDTKPLGVYTGYEERDFEIADIDSSPEKNK